MYDVTAGIPAVIEEVTPGGSVYYIREPGGELIARCTGTSGQNILYYHFDELGSTRMLTDANGHITDARIYLGFAIQLMQTPVHQIGEEKPRSELTRISGQVVAIVGDAERCFMS